MGKRASSAIDTAAKRARLEPRRNPYWQGISGGRGGVSLGYRKAARGPGTWVAKLVIDKQRAEERLAPADDAGAVAGALPYPAAVSETLAWAKKQFAKIEAENSDRGASPTVRGVVEAYVKARKERHETAARDAESRLKKHVLADAKFADLPLAKLTARDVLSWRGRLPEKLAPSTVNRLLNDVRAALNGAAELHRRELPASLPGEIKAGTKALSVGDNARKQVLSDTQIKAALSAAAAVDDTGDFGRLILLLAATGARFSQVARLTVGDVQIARSRITVPVSRKGRAGKAVPKLAIPVGPDVIEHLRPAFDRGAEDPLLLHWVSRQIGPVEWERVERKPWKQASEALRLWDKARAKAELPADTMMTAFRHSSIVRGLKANLPVRLVAALHDTSIQMIEKHYSAYIVDASEELARRAILSVA
ncbi:tyrosine-type recombinase/integrase [Enterovirga sp. CN4-39]|uniref:tyrosine-type recombinase/integrase n=1 Tax=Enterovirga sp. CN4-39 TaxID=3400910 RepID=UPI003BFAF667